MHDESAKESQGEAGAPSVLAGAPLEAKRPTGAEGELQETAGKDEPAPATADNKQNLTGKSQPDTRSERDKNELQLRANDSQLGALFSGIGNNHRYQNNTYNYSSSSPTDAQQSLDILTTIEELQSSGHAYKSLDSSTIAAYSGVLLTQRILLVSCHHYDIALNVARTVAYQTNIANKKLITLDKNTHGHYNFRNLIDLLVPSETKTTARQPESICVFASDETSDDDIASTILASLLVDSATIEQYKTRLDAHGVWMICLVSPQRIKDYKDARLTVSLQNWEIDFLAPLLESAELSDYERLATLIDQQRRAGQWSDDGSDFYKQVVKHLREGTLLKIVEAGPPSPHCDVLSLQQLFNREDPLIDAVLYCATYFPNLSPQDFSYLVELYLGDATEDVLRQTDRSESQDGNEAASVFEAVPLARRWRRRPDLILDRCKLAALPNEYDRRVVDFKVDGLRNRLRPYIRNEHYFFYESSFNLIRRQGLLFSPRKEIADGARQLLVDMATEYAADEVADWLYEIVSEFEEMAAAADLLQEHSTLFQLLPDSSIKAARRYVGHGLSLVLNRLNREPGLQKAVRLFWQRLLRFQHRWFLDLLRRMGSFPPAESLTWLRQLIDQGTNETRRQVLDYLIAYLLHKDASVYPTLKEIMQWPTTTQAGQIAQEVLIIYYVATNRQLAQTEYGQWPSLHPLFGFQDRAAAQACLDLLIEWLFGAAYEMAPDDAMFDIANIVAGWYFVLSPPSLNEAANEASDTRDALNSQRVRDLLLTSLARHCSRAQRKGLLTRWAEMKSDALEEVFRLDALANQFIGSLNSELTSDVATVRRKLMAARAQLSELRKDFLRCAEESTSA